MFSCSTPELDHLWLDKDIFWVQLSLQKENEENPKPRPEPALSPIAGRILK